MREDSRSRDLSGGGAGRTARGVPACGRPRRRRQRQARACCSAPVRSGLLTMLAAQRAGIAEIDGRRHRGGAAGLRHEARRQSCRRYLRRRRGAEGRGRGAPVRRRVRSLGHGRGPCQRHRRRQARRRRGSGRQSAGRADSGAGECGHGQGDRPPRLVPLRDGILHRGRTDRRRQRRRAFAGDGANARCRSRPTRCGWRSTARRASRSC